MINLNPRELKEQLSKNINSNIAGLGRDIQVDYTLDYEEGDIIVLDNAESWSNCGEFIVETEAEYGYTFIIENEVPCHVLDYSNDEICHVLGATDCEKEKEVILAKGLKFIVTNASTDQDFNEMGYYEIRLEYMEEDK